LQIHSNMYSINFLETLLADYNYLASKWFNQVSMKLMAKIAFPYL
jgi:hypothetical protein